MNLRHRIIQSRSIQLSYVPLVRRCALICRFEKRRTVAVHYYELQVGIIVSHILLIPKMLRIAIRVLYAVATATKRRTNRSIRMMYLRLMELLCGMDGFEPPFPVVLTLHYFRYLAIRSHSNVVQIFVFGFCTVTDGGESEPSCRP